ncbi:hypothetical protein L873DRAFT_1829131 [Choiromyces venosus 120613-1]|uniref:AA9 family lytic polysaccharide monooxygenase n=1 Tax=Choiromyces venosus 120613-1 TaxID=1336337 RepID=A0A3N4JG64_9PEZI|nr:hypothetical protein L873DRAFT_1829131 [Choiromyces venosus 120613-1]
MPAFAPTNPRQSTIQRQYSSYDPILTSTRVGIRCNNAGQTSKLTAPIATSSTITAVWTQRPGDCASFDGSGAVWFKIDEAGLLSGTLNKGEWGNGVILKTLKWTTAIPSVLVAGNYIIRHEVLALHQANTPQFYPECARIIVTGGGGSITSTYIVPGPAVWPGGPSTNPGTPVSSDPPASTVVPPVSSTGPTTSVAATPTGAGVAKYSQCGGIGQSGSTNCVSSTCTKVNDYCYQVFRTSCSIHSLFK